MSAVNDIKRGHDALVVFHNASSRYDAYGNMSFDQLLSIMSEKSNGQFLDGFGFAINSAELEDEDVFNSMQRLADAGQGKIPARWTDFFNALKKDPSGFSFEALAFVTKESISDLGDGLVEIGETAKETLENAKGLVAYLPYLAFAGLGFYIFMRAKRA